MPSLRVCARFIAALMLIHFPVMAQQALQSATPIRHPVDGPSEVPLAFRGQKIEQIVPFIAEASGKKVIPSKTSLKLEITIVNDRPIPTVEALDALFIAMHQAGVAVVETADTIFLRDITEIDQMDLPVIGPDVRLANRRDKGVIVEKVFRLRFSSAENLGKLLSENLPANYKVIADKDSNQLSAVASIGYLQRLEEQIGHLDKPGSGSLMLRTFHLKYADATRIAENIKELYVEEQSGSSTQRQTQRSGWGFGRGGQQNQQQETSAANTEVRVTTVKQQNAVTVLAGEATLAQIERQIQEDWDMPLPKETLHQKVFKLRASDATKITEVLAETFGEPGSEVDGSVTRVTGDFTFQAIPASNQILVTTTSAEHIALVGEIIADIDVPQDVGIPKIVELKYTDAEELAEQLNALLALSGAGATIRRTETGLSASDASQSPFSDQSTASNEQVEEDPDEMQFWWAQGRAGGTQGLRDPSNLVGQIRLVPNWRQNAIMVLAPPEYEAKVIELINELDQPGRQVLISAIVAEISKDDATSLGLRWSSGTIPIGNADNSFGLGADFSGTEADFLGGLFSTSVLDVGVDINLLLQALAQNTSVNILTEPKIFTADNQEAEFFDGQDIAFPVSSTVTEGGATTQQTDYRSVGIQFRARPRITPNRDIDLRVNVEISSIRQGEIVNGNIVVDRRETTTQLVIQDGQTVVISGINRSEEVDILRKVPLLGDIPLLGLIFQSRDTIVVDSELLIFITPIVMDNPEEINTINREKGFLQELQNRREYHYGDDTSGQQ